MQSEKLQAIFSSNYKNKRLQCYDWLAKLFYQPVKNDLRTYNIRKIATGQGDDYWTSCLLDYCYFKEHYKMIAIALSKQQALDADPKAIQQTIFIGNLGE